jgi:hypothetical protein
MPMGIAMKRHFLRHSCMDAFLLHNYRIGANWLSSPDDTSLSIAVDT